MTDEDRQLLCGILRGPDAKFFAAQAADEIERLDAQLEQEQKENDAAFTVRQHYLDQIEQLEKKVEQLEARVEASQRM